MAYTFQGGVHPDDNKSYTNNIPINVLDGVNEHVFPLQQHIGAPLTPVVEIGSPSRSGRSSQTRTHLCPRRCTVRFPAR